MQTIICGSPKSGKTTLAKSYEDKGLKVLHTDSLITQDWSADSEVACTLIGNQYDVMEGTMAVRALRKWLQRNAGKPCDVVIWCKQKETLTTRQQNMANGCQTIFNQIHADLRSRGVRILEQ